ncbi:MAG: SPOR domain-containing protein [Prevotella sp.]|jgi:hypothetical protein|nr:SPOR domain-containing protein [Prevotella sp.]
MKVLHTTLLLAIIIVISSCKSQDQALKDFYRNTNNQMKRESFLIKSSPATPAQQYEERSINSSAESAYMAQVKAKSEQFHVIYDESEYANGDVYLEAAKHRQALIEKANKDCPDCPKTTSVTTTTTISQPTTSTGVSANTQSTSGTPDFFAHLLNTDKKLIRTEGVSYTNTDDKAKLKKYNVVIAALSKYEGTERLKNAFAGSGESLTILKNDSGLYYVIIGSFDTEGQAMDKIKSIEREYNSRYTAAQLQSKYGITFTNLWILRK